MPPYSGWLCGCILSLLGAVDAVRGEQAGRRADARSPGAAGTPAVRRGGAGRWADAPPPRGAPLRGDGTSITGHCVRSSRGFKLQRGAPRLRPHLRRAPAPPPPATRPGRAAQRLGVVGGVLAHSPDPPPTLRPPSYGQAEAASVERCVFDLRASCRENESGDPLFATRVPGPHLEHNALATWRVKIIAASPTVTLPSAPHGTARSPLEQPPPPPPREPHRSPCSLAPPEQTGRADASTARSAARRCWPARSSVAAATPRAPSTCPSAWLSRSKCGRMSSRWPTACAPRSRRRRSLGSCVRSGST